MSDPHYLSETWYDPRLELRPSPTHGTGMFATDLIREGEVVMIWGGTLYVRADLKAGKVPGDTSYSFIEEDVLLAAPGDGMDYFVNHSCDPSVWMADRTTVVARRDIQPGEEITGDYVVWESDPSYTVDPCMCGTEYCRGRFTGDDWRLPELQARYQGHFLPYISARIAGSAAAM
jgi:uncharacterized protein